MNDRDAGGGPHRPAPRRAGGGNHTAAHDFGARLLAWAGETTRRDLPWRQTRDPWAVLVSEVMLQQTQVTRVVPVYRRFLRAFPTPAACAAAGAGTLLQMWSGLGYNRRAVRLHEAANRIVDEHDGAVPASLEALRALPGVGDYTARAVLAFAFEQRFGVVDTNVARVLARAVAGTPLTRGQAQALADRLVDRGNAWQHNQAMLDLGAMICRRRSPRCNECPVAADCLWQDAGAPSPDPAATTAGVSGRQGTFTGSDRQGRGRLVAALCEGPVAHDRLGVVMGWQQDPARARRVAADLVAEGLAEDNGTELVLPS